MIGTILKLGTSMTRQDRVAMALEVALVSFWGIGFDIQRTG
jgi:hypothetical protein